ncbi:hypothetical protein TOPH_03002 [Tolypocladium ophioglossoides CBS 100239]|uniref:Galactose oxidase n=1 Tax=Tolypocladium ophioglossoides (strain CBS 100239) TaxID=1163406 RepID=A0A0L0NDR4_TOLOC|nr:hypothetical protein TOPH_03002 [Tolypocladium ophioglossoides CBS 100239]
MAANHSATGWAALALGLGLALAQPATAAAHSLPYVPTRLLVPSACSNASTCRGRDVAYIFAQGGGDGAAVQFLALNYSSGVAGGATPEAVTTALPFLKDAGATTAFGAARTGNGTVVVYAGACDGQAGDVWSYDPDAQDATIAGWTKRTTTEAGQQGGRGPYFLGETLAFSTTLAPTMDQPTIYNYGGMCLPPQTDAATWQADGNYTKTMLSLGPASQQPGTAYGLRVASVSGPRVPFAGFTATQLPASVTNISGAVTQQAGFVFLGGHTQQAFINMSTAAVWTLPEESWSYVNVQPPAEEPPPGKELAVKQVHGRAPANVYSRSGHTAVLSEDGRSVVVLGGWVGDVDTPAVPQLAVLEMSQAYSSWRWRIPGAQPGGAGIYGHGAALLPGNVMVVYGGWQTQPAGAGTRRQAATALRFLNLTSMAWAASYVNPNPNAGAPPGAPPGAGLHDAPGAGRSSDSARRLGLGLGMGLGFALLLGVVLAFLRWRMRRRRRQAQHDEAVRAMAEDAKHFLHDTDMAERDGFPWGRRDWRAGGSRDPSQQADRSLGYESLRGGRGDAASAGVSAGVARKPVARALRGGYVPAETRFSAFVSPPGVIHPIFEDDEVEYGHRGTQPGEPLTPTSEAPSDPFLTPTGASPGAPPARASATPSPEHGARRHDPDVQDWAADVDAADALLARYSSTRQGRASPTRRSSGRSTGYLRDDDSRTGSNLSESNRSAADSLRRSASSRREPPKPGSSSSYNTARSGFGALQAEAPGLLMGGRGDDDDDDDDDPDAEDDPDGSAPGSPSKSRPRRGWLGSLRRAFSTSGTTSSTNTASRDESPPAPPPSGSDCEPRPAGGLSGELLRRKQGRRDWEGARPQQQGENEWDIERAVEQRLVQVMFTVPRERLRVVNGDADAAADTADTADNERDHQHHHQHQPQVAELVDPSSASSLRTITTTDRDTPDRERLHIDAAEKRLSHSTDGSGRRSSGAVFTAEAVTFERPRTRVLQMVDSIESRSPEGSPTREAQ